MIPKSLQNFKSSQEEYLKGLQFFKIKEVQDKCEKTIRKMLINEPFNMRISAENLFKVLKDGRFKNLLETGTSGGFADIEGRIENTKKLFGADIANMEAKDHPKFGYLGTMNSDCDIYGDVIVTFKKENLWNTTTFSAHDSLLYENNLKPSFVSDPKLCAFCWEKDIPKLSSALDIYNKNGFNAFREMLDTDYVELQFHKDLETSDIEKIEFTNFVDSPLKENLETKLQELHIPYKI